MMIQEFGTLLVSRDALERATKAADELSAAMIRVSVTVSNSLPSGSWVYISTKEYNDYLRRGRMYRRRYERHGQR
jgi:hypothetical protein